MYNTLYKRISILSSQILSFFVLFCRSCKCLICASLNKNYTAKELSGIFNIHISSVYRIVKQKIDTGCVKLQTNKRGRKSVLTEKDFKNISGLIDSQPDIIINEIIEKSELKATNETVGKAVIKM